MSNGGMHMKAKLPSGLPPLGQRILKTGIAVALCLLFYMLRGYQGRSMSAEAAITAILCMQHDVQDSREYAMNRLIGSLIGAALGLIFLLMMMHFPSPAEKLPILYSLMGVGVLIALYIPVLLHKPDICGLTAIVFICVVIAYPEIEAPLQQAFRRITGVLVGTAAAIGVNIVRLPGKRQKDTVFFVSLEDLIPDRLGQVSPAVLFRLNSLYRDGARICLTSQHAPAFILPQLSAVKMMNLPLIVMDGAAVYDPKENHYPTCVHPDSASSRWLMKRLDDLGTGYFIYTVHKDRNCIYHPGPMRPEEEEAYRQFRRSPYRYYLDSDHYALTDVVYIKAVVPTEEAEKILRTLRRDLAAKKLRAALRPQPGQANCSGLYFYASAATIPHTREHLMQLLRQKEPGLKAQAVESRTQNPTGHDTVRLLHALSRAYKPFRPFEHLRNRM